MFLSQSFPFLLLRNPILGLFHHLTCCIDVLSSF
ncbi:unnamed protein product [Brugia timori]|uniref:Uncharacterized protein n=1 Tax=Brugia timori TaxID=42155 RepID=A0A0R3QSB6_9BILA|nr:unnamed protein product [Brugia timori]